MMLQTARLCLRRWLPSDLEPFAALNRDPEVMRYFPALRDRAESAASMRRIEADFEAHGFGGWAMDLPGTGFIGFCGLMVPRFTAHFTPCVEIGWRMARAHWGQGYATEAARAALADGFSRISLPEVVAFTPAGNRASWRLMERAGMVRDLLGDFDHPDVPEGDPLQRFVLYRISAPTGH
jgi:RimJ/RimL family protein N-acetyltransferase